MDNLLLALGTTIQKGNVLHVLSFIPLLSYQLSPLLLVVLWRYVLSAILAGQMSTQYFLLLTSKEGAYADMFYEKRPPPKWIFISHAHAWIVALILSFIGILGVTLHPEVFYRAALGGIVLYGPYNTSIWSLIPSICLCGISFVYGVIIMALVIFKLSKSMDRGRYLGISVCIILSTITNAGMNLSIQQIADIAFTALSFTNINEDIGIYTSNAGELVFFFGLLLCERILVSTQEVQYNRSTNTN
jgi:hypothetical protein